MNYFIRAIITILITSHIAVGQTKEVGLPFISNFTPKEYHANTQNWAIAEDDRGVMYFGNNKGVLEYDGVSWRLIPVVNKSIVRSLAIDKDGVIFVGAVGEFGYMAPNEQGELTYHSLIHLIKDRNYTFSDVWTTLIRDDEVFFQSFNMLFRYKDGKIKTWPLNNAYHRMFNIDGKIYLRENDKGLMVMEDSTLNPVPMGELFSNEHISSMIKLDEGILIGSRNQGLFLYSPQDSTITRYPAKANDVLIENKIYHGTALDNGNIAFATLNAGVVVIDKGGNIVLELDETKGLQYQIVYNLYSDSYGSLWASLANGISKIEVMSPITIFDQISGLTGGILAINRYQGTLYVSTHQGAFYLNGDNNFEKIKNVDAQSWELTKYEIPDQPGKQILLLTASDGIYEISGGSARRVFKGRVGAVSVHPDYPQRLFVGIIGKILSLRYDQGKWSKEMEVDLPEEEIRSIQPDRNGNVWIGTIYGGAFKLNVHGWQENLANKNKEFANSIENYGLDKGLPSINWNFFFEIDKQLLITSREGIFRYNVDSDFFEKHPEIDEAFGYENRWVYYIRKDSEGNLYFDSDQGKGILIKQGNKYRLFESPFKRIIVSPENQVTGYADDDGILWFGTPDGLFRYDSKYQREAKDEFNVLIRNVTVAGDSVIFKGAYFQSKKTENDVNTLVSLKQPEALKPVLDYENNSIAFQFASTAFEHESGNVYSYKLEGYDDKWSPWTKETKKEYTNLPKGKYNFRIKAKNFYDNESPEANFNFEILAPWYQTFWAYLAYIIAAMTIMYIVTKAYSQRLKNDNLRLEAMVETRTAEINHQKEEIEKQKNEVERSYRNVTTLSQIGQDITSTLDLRSIIDTLYHSIDSIMDASAFGVGLYNEQNKTLEFKYAFEASRELPFFEHSLSEGNKMAVWSFNNCKEVFINDLNNEYKNYIGELTKSPTAGSAHCESIIYVPLKVKNKMMGVISVQSFKKNAYQPFHLDILRTLAAYTAIALDNSYAYLRLNEINEELFSTLENLKQTQSQLVQSEKMASLGQLTAGVAHEINNPINFVSAGIDSLSVNYDDLNEIIQKYNQLTPETDNSALLQEIEDLKKELDIHYLLEEIPMLLKSIKSGANRTTEIVKSLRNFTRLDEDQLKKANINEGLDSTLVILRNQIGDRIQIVRQYGEVPPINCYPGQLNQVFMNILNNAVQAIDDEGTIYIETFTTDLHVVIKIKDTGKGMNLALKEKIFDPFFTTKDVGEGTGLGLSISYGIIEKHKGKIEVSSTPGEGTEFIIEIPLNLN